MSGKLQQLQHSSLNTLRSQQVPAAADLVNGIKRQGLVASLDQHVVLPKNAMHRIARTHAISSLSPARMITLPATHAKALAGQDVRN